MMLWVLGPCFLGPRFLGFLVSWFLGFFGFLGPLGPWIFVKVLWIWRSLKTLWYLDLLDHCFLWILEFLGPWSCDYWFLGFWNIGPLVSWFLGVWVLGSFRLVCWVFLVCPLGPFGSWFFGFLGSWTLESLDPSNSWFFGSLTFIVRGHHDIKCPSTLIGMFEYSASSLCSFSTLRMLFNWMMSVKKVRKGNENHTKGRDVLILTDLRISGPLCSFGPVLWVLGSLGPFEFFVSFGSLVPPSLGPYILCFLVLGFFVPWFLGSFGSFGSLIPWIFGPLRPWDVGILWVLSFLVLGVLVPLDPRCFCSFVLWVLGSWDCGPSGPRFFGSLLPDWWKGVGGWVVLDVVGRLCVWMCGYRWKYVRKWLGTLMSLLWLFFLSSSFVENF